MYFTAPGSEREQLLMDEFLEIVNERDLLVMKENRLNTLENIRDEEKKYKACQSKIAELLMIDGNFFWFFLKNPNNFLDEDKTEKEKRLIDGLMERMQLIVNKRDELEHALMDVEEEIEMKR